MTTLTDSEFVLVLRAARVLYTAAKAERAEYEREHAERGHIPERCIHGAYMWVDHDIPCGACEVGITLRQMAVQRAFGEHQVYKERVAFAREADRLHPPGHDSRATWAWVWGASPYLTLAAEEESAA